MRKVILDEWMVLLGHQLFLLIQRLQHTESDLSMYMLTVVTLEARFHVEQIDRNLLYTASRKAASSSQLVLRHFDAALHS